MNRALGVALLAAVLFAPAGCHRKKKAAPEAAVEEGPRTATMVTLGDPKSAPQLVSGFYDIENGAWRWTGKQFTAELGVPFGSGQKGAALELNFTVPDVVIEKSKTVTLSASVDGNALPPETYSKAGEYTYKRDVPPALLNAASVKVTFTLDKTIQPGGGDLRDLGIVAASVGLKGK
jgi:hypothetical protein